jgi:polyphosphate kinase 2 (PPK2 family)
MNILNKYEETIKIGKKEYTKELEKYQLRFTILQQLLRKEGIPLMLAFEGWDASGKGGAIKRLTGKLDPRGLKVYPVGAPTEDELSKNYLWRFWNRIPRKGEIVIFDRSWYGRVLVERIEGFATENEWKRAYFEINEFEKTLVDDNYILLKFFIHISKVEQLSRFTARQEDPFKAWKITEEDWRNREKWDQYWVATEEMVHKTSTDYAPWKIIRGNNKRHARLEVIRTVTEKIELVCNVDKEKVYPETAR